MSRRVGLKRYDMRQVVDLCYRVARLVEKDNYRPAVIVAVGRGGMVPARFIADILDVRDMGFLNARRHTGVFETGKLGMEVLGDWNGHVLYVDDLVGDGTTLAALQTAIAAAERFKRRGDTCRTAALITKAASARAPDFTGIVYPGTAWTVFPWDEQETRRDLLRLYSGSRLEAAQ
jgi:hypoxanthine phosphoribosyltransferase